MLEKEPMKQSPSGRDRAGIKMTDRGNEGLWGVRRLIEEINWYRMKPKPYVKKQMLFILHF